MSSILTSAEIEFFGQLGFDCDREMWSVRRPRKDYVVVTFLLRLNDKYYQDQVLVEVAADCNEKGMPLQFHVLDATVLRKFDFKHYHIDKGLPTKEQIVDNAQKVINVYEEKEKIRQGGTVNEQASHAKTVYSKMNKTDQICGSSPKQKL